MKSKPPTLPDRKNVDGLMRTAREIAQLAAKKASEIESGGRLPNELMQALGESKLLRLLQPRYWGGYETDMPTFVRVATEVAKGDTSTGWVFCILGVHNFWINYVEPELQREIWGKDPATLMADSFAPTGTAERVSGGYQVTGRWNFLSGLWCSDWVAVGALISREPKAKTEWAMMFIPKADFRPEDCWNVVGMQGSGSDSIVVDKAFVPHHRVYWLEHAEKTGHSPGRDLHPNPLYQLPFVPTLGLSLVPAAVGAARAAIEHFREWTTKRQGVYGDHETEAAGTASTQIALAEAVTTVDAVEGLMHRHADELMAEYANSTKVPTSQERAKYYAWRSYIVRQSTRVVDRLFEMSGGRALFLHHPLQRIWRDMHAICQHLALHYESGMESYGRTLVGLSSRSPL